MSSRNQRNRPDHVPDDLSDVAQDYGDLDQLRDSSAFKSPSPRRAVLVTIVVAVLLVVAVVLAAVLL